MLVRLGFWAARVLMAFNCGVALYYAATEREAFGFWAAIGFAWVFDDMGRFQGERAP